MSDERFERIEQWQQSADGRLDRIDHWQRHADERFNHLDERFAEIDKRFDRVDERFAEIDQRFDRVDERLEIVNQRVGVLHEDVLSRIAATGESAPPTKREMAQGFADLRELIERRLEPLELAVRQHTKEIQRLKRHRG